MSTSVHNLKSTIEKVHNCRKNRTAETQQVELAATTAQLI